MKFCPVLLVSLSFLCIGSNALYSLFPIEIGLSGEDPFLPLERDMFDDCHIRYMRYGRDELTIPDPLEPYDEPRDYSHIASIGSTLEGGRVDWKCIGALIWDNVVLTSAHCTTGEGNNAPNVVRLGGPTYVQQRNIKEIIRHPEFSPRNGQNDIALIHLDGKIAINATAVPTCLWLSDEIPFPNMDSVFRTAANRDQQFSDYGTEVMNRLNIKSQNCTSPTTRDQGLPATQLCMESAEFDASECTEMPEGNPLQVRLLHNFKTSPFLVGILSSSFTLGSCNPRRGYTKIAHYRDWLMGVLLERNISVTPQAFFPMVCAHRFAQLRPRVDELLNERNGDIPVNTVQLGSNSNRYLNYIVQFEWPSVTENRTQSDCAGTFVDQQTILTLATCVLSTNEDGSRPTAAIHVTPYANNSYPIESITVHPGYVKGSHKNNIAVVKLKTRQNVVPACIWPFDNLPSERVDLTGVGMDALNTFQERFIDNPDRVSNVLVQHATDYYPWTNCTEELARLSDNRSLAIFNNEEHLCFRSDQWIVPGVCKDIPGGPVQRYINRAGAFFKYVYALTVIGRTCGYGEPTVAIQLAPHVAWLQSVMLQKRSSGSGDLSESVIFINPDLKRSDECSNGDDSLGICVPHELCLSTKERLRKGERVTICTEGSIVCCPWGDIARNSAVDPIRTELESCEDRYQSIRRERYRGEDENESLYTNLPHMAEIGWPQNNGRINFECLGYLITPRIIVISARCMETYPHKPTVARIGSVQASDASNYVLQPIRRVRVHEDYDPLTGVNNIALVALTAPIEINVFHFPGCLYRNNTHIPARLFTINENKGTTFVGKIAPAYQSECKEHLAEELAPGQMCLWKPQPEARWGVPNACLNTGDPIIWENRTEVMDIIDATHLVGIFSHGGCEVENVQIVTRISFFYDWIVLNAK
uniref:Peptidase S1 domain-containing protein n=1 Tax=Anopheles funestus TaxID=62324 RepID=A0A182RZ22_ANOFN